MSTPSRRPHSHSRKHKEASALPSNVPSGAGKMPVSILKKGGAPAHSMKVSPAESAVRGGRQLAKAREPGGQFSRALAANGQHYVLSLCDPFSTRDVRVPDILSWPTCTTTFRTVRSVVTSTSVKKQIACQPVFYANPSAGGTDPLGSAFSSRDAADATLYGDWSNDPDSAANQAAVTAGMGYWRTVSFGTELIPTSPIERRSGMISAIRVPALGTSQFSDELNSMDSNPNTVSVAGNSDFRGFKMTWRPLTYQDGLDFVRDGQTILNARGAIVYEFPATPIYQNSYQLIITHNVEFVPFTSLAQLFDPASAPGSEEHVATAWMATEARAGDPSGSTDARWTEVLASSARSVLKEYGPGLAKQALRLGVQYVSAAAGAPVSVSAAEAAARSRQRSPSPARSVSSVGSAQLVSRRR